MHATDRHAKKVVIVGAGFGGLNAAKSLKNARVNITVLDQNNYHLFQPFLYQVATANFSPSDIASPIRNVLKKQKNTLVVMEKVININKNEKLVITNSGNQYVYDYLIIATGSRHSYFGENQWSQYTLGLKSLGEALLIRERILLSFEKAEATTDKKLKEEYLNFVIVGGGPTGVEMAGAVQELAARSLEKEFKHIKPSTAKVILIEAGQRILNAFPENLAKLAEHKLCQMGVEMLVKEKVIDIKENLVRLASRDIAAHTIIWAAGVTASKAASWLDVKAEQSGRIVVNPDLSVPNIPNVFVIGDTCALWDSKTQNYLPGLGSIAKQQGKYVGRLIGKSLKGKTGKPFHHKNYGNLAVIGRKYAISDFKKLQFDGFFSYILWWAVHIYFLIGFRKRLSVLMNWVWSYFTFERGARLIIKNPFICKNVKL